MGEPSPFRPTTHTHTGEWKKWPRKKLISIFAVELFFFFRPRHIEKSARAHTMTTTICVSRCERVWLRALSWRQPVANAHSRDFLWALGAAFFLLIICNARKNAFVSDDVDKKRIFVWSQRELVLPKGRASDGMREGMEIVCRIRF